MSTPTGLSRRELYIDARDLQSDSDPDKPLTPEEYSAILTARGREKLAEHKLVQSLSTDVRTRNATYEFGVDYQLGDTITDIDERLGVTADVVVPGVQHAVVGDKHTMTLTFGHEQPTIGALLKRKEDK